MSKDIENVRSLNNISIKERKVISLNDVVKQ